MRRQKSKPARAALVEDHDRVLPTPESEITMQREPSAHPHWEHTTAKSSAAALAASLERSKEEHSAWKEMTERARNDALRALLRTKTELVTSIRAHLTLAMQNDAHAEHSALKFEHTKLQRDRDALRACDGELRSERDFARSADPPLQNRVLLFSRMSCATSAWARRDARKRSASRWHEEIWILQRSGS